MTTVAPAGPGHPFLTVSLARELGFLFTLSVMFPFMIHILPVPSDARMGPRLLPMFYAPLLAALLGRQHSALLVALVAPWLNWALTTHPAPPGAVLLTIQLSAFVIVSRLLQSPPGARAFVAVPAFLAALAVTALVVAVMPSLIGGRGALQWALESLALGWPGVAILGLINWFVNRSYPPGSGDGGPLAA
jgi:hypothetical protein